MSTVTILSHWLTEHRCVSCGHVVSYHTRMYSHGRCPHCGYKGKHAGTIMDTTEHAFRWVRDGEVWQLWKPRRKQYLTEVQPQEGRVA